MLEELVNDKQLFNCIENHSKLLANVEINVSAENIRMEVMNTLLSSAGGYDSLKTLVFFLRN